MFLCFLNVLDHLWPVLGGRYFEVCFVSCVVTSKCAVMGFTHCFFPVLQGRPGIVELQSDPDHLVLVLESFLCQIFEIDSILLW